MVLARVPGCVFREAVASADHGFLYTDASVLHPLEVCHVVDVTVFIDHACGDGEVIGEDGGVGHFKLLRRFKQGIDSRFEFVNVERLGDVFICACAHGNHFTVFIGQCGDDDDGGALKEGISP